jgi:hypothetical protein
LYAWANPGASRQRVAKGLNAGVAMICARLGMALKYDCSQVDAMMATIEDLEGDKGRLEAEIEAVRSKVQSELDEVDFRLGVQV